MERKWLEWKFQPPRSSHFVGAHKSLFRSTKLALYHALEEEKKLYWYPTEDRIFSIGLLLLKFRMGHFQKYIIGKDFAIFNGWPIFSGTCSARVTFSRWSKLRSGNFREETWKSERMEPNQPREWLTVRITKTFRGEKGLVRVV